MESLSSKEVDSKTLDRLAENERHFHNIQAGIRGLASTWMLAAFGGIALLLQQQNEVTWQFHPLGLIVVICVMANVGLSILWIIDQPVYQRLFNTNYVAGLRLEQQFSFIPPVRAMQWLTTQGTSIASWVKFFYVMPMLAFATTAFLAALIVIITVPNPSILLMAQGALGVAASAPLVWVFYKAREVSVERLVRLLPNNYKTILDDNNLRQIIERHVALLNDMNSNR
jgi:hypothetical protein